MSFMGGITDFLTGGANDHAEQALNDALAAYNNVKTPDKTDLTLPQLQQYVQAGILTPEQAQAVLEKNNAYNDISTDPRAREASLDALTSLQSIGDAGAKGTPQEQAALAEAEGKMNQNLQGQRSSILDQMDQRGIPSSLMGVSEQLAAAGEDSEQAHRDALTAEANNSNMALQALEQSGNLGNQISGQQFSEKAQKAQAQNAIDQWNAANQTTVNLNNAQMRQNADNINTQTAQNVSNANTQNTNARTQYNSQLPQQVFNDQMTKANGIAGVDEKRAGQQTAVGEQNAGTAAGMLNLISPSAAQIPSGASSGSAAPAASAGSSIGQIAPEAAMMMSKGGVVPGMPHMPGNSPANDTQPALLSPGEVVIPRTAAHDPRTALAFIKHMHRQTAQSPAHPDDVKSVLHALGSMRNGGM